MTNEIAYLKKGSKVINIPAVMVKNLGSELDGWQRITEEEYREIKEGKTPSLDKVLGVTKPEVITESWATGDSPKQPRKLGDSQQPDGEARLISARILPGGGTATKWHGTPTDEQKEEVIAALKAGNVNNEGFTLRDERDEIAGEEKTVDKNDLTRAEEMVRPWVDQQIKSQPTAGLPAMNLPNASPSLPGPSAAPKAAEKAPAKGAESVEKKKTGRKPGAGSRK